MSTSALKGSHGGGARDPVDFVRKASKGEFDDWLRARLAGRDAVLPLDVRSGEDPETLIVEIVRELGEEHPVSAAIGRAALRLLHECRAEAPILPPYWESLLGMCRRQVLPATESWFLRELQELADDPAVVESRWGGSAQVLEILHAALVQAPGFGGSAARNLWRGLLEHPSYATVALHGLGRSFRQRLVYLETWWGACPEPKRTNDLRGMIRTALRLGPDRLLMELRGAEGRLPSDLRQAINDQLESESLEPIFREEQPAMAVTGSVSNAIFGAATLYSSPNPR